MSEFAAALYERPGQDGQRRRQIVAILQAALESVDPAAAVRRQLRREGDTLWASDVGYDLGEVGRIFVVGAGKAGAPMAWAVEEVLGDRISSGQVTVKYEHLLSTRIVMLQEAGHPIPDEAGVAGSRAIVRLLESAEEDDLVICLISGGGSALMTLPIDGISLADTKAVTGSLLRAGATINEINAIRKHLDQLKGGQLARLAYPARTVSLILSDVVGNPLDVIASGPTVPDTSSFAEAYGLLQRHELLEEVPQSVVSHLRRGTSGEVAETPKAGDPAFARTLNLIVASNTIAAEAAERAAHDAGMHTMLLSTYIEGEAREVGKVLGALAKEVLASGRPVERPACLIVGGETTVTLRGKGKGGRNQEMALAAALSIQDLEDVTIVCLATDGTDGPTDASGALADGSTIRRAREHGLDPWHLLETNDSYYYFSPLNDLLLTGPTNTNVNDLAFVFVW